MPDMVKCVASLGRFVAGSKGARGWAYNGYSLLEIIDGCGSIPEDGCVIPFSKQEALTRICANTVQLMNIGTSVIGSSRLYTNCKSPCCLHPREPY